jgi:hypothetical protein
MKDISLIKISSVADPDLGSSALDLRSGMEKIKIRDPGYTTRIIFPTT